MLYTVFSNVHSQTKTCSVNGSTVGGLWHQTGYHGDHMFTSALLAPAALAPRASFHGNGPDTPPSLPPSLVSRAERRPLSSPCIAGVFCLIPEREAECVGTSALGSRHAFKTLCCINPAPTPASCNAQNSYRPETNTNLVFFFFPHYLKYLKGVLDIVYFIYDLDSIDRNAVLLSHINSYLKVL